MQPPQLPTPSGLPGFDLTGVLPYCLAAVTGVLGWFGSQFTAGAALQRTLLNASRQWVEQSQDMLAHRDARILELEAQIAQLRLENLQQGGEIRSLKQLRDSLIALLKRSGIEIPGE